MGPRNHNPSKTGFCTNGSNGVCNTIKRTSGQFGKRAAVWAYLADPERFRLCNRAIARQVGCGATLVNELRRVYARGSEALPPPGVHAGTPEPGRAPPGLPRNTFEVPPLDSLQGWHNATPAERAKFVDAVGLWNLFNAAPEDHRVAFVARLARLAVAALSSFS